ncbi:MAG TPA: hypothetical protein PKE64_18725 [Anaerolineae bacterium]|nr:hypothetical protein [Anaerolineae bacterium]HMR66049.1 hypothetical protein [Anaerolineae bacterium]
MPDDDAPSNLSDKQYIALLIRLLVDRRGRIQHGALLDLNRRTIAQFRQLDELPALITAWLQTLARPPDSS